MAIIFPFCNISSSNFAVILILARCFSTVTLDLLIFKYLRSLNLSISYKYETAKMCPDCRGTKVETGA